MPLTRDARVGASGGTVRSDTNRLARAGAPTSCGCSCCSRTGCRSRTWRASRSAGSGAPRSSSGARLICSCTTWTTTASCAATLASPRCVHIVARVYQIYLPPRKSELFFIDQNVDRCEASSEKERERERERERDASWSLRAGAWQAVRVLPEPSREEVAGVERRASGGGRVVRRRGLVLRGR